MPVMVCPACGSEYISSVAVCPEDGTLLVESDFDEMEAAIDEEVAEAADREEAGLADEEDGTRAPAGEQIAYELDAWDGASRTLLDQLLTGEGIVHVWEAGTLVIRAEDEEAADALVDQVEITTQPTLDPAKDQVVYELTDWPDPKRDALEESLDGAGIPFGLDEQRDLVVHEEDEERVETILDQVDLNFEVSAADIAEGVYDEPDDGEDGLDVQDKLSDLFVAADRLMHDAKDKEGIAGVVLGAEQVVAMRLPYGFAAGVWADIVERSTSLRAVLTEEPLPTGTGDDEDADDAEVEAEDVDVEDAEVEDADGTEVDDAADDGDDAEEDGRADPRSDEGIELAARELRDLLRQYV